MNSKSQIAAAFAFAALGFVSLTGCHMPSPWGPPGDMNTQRARSMQHDPYPSNELGPPIHGIRPRGFDQPRSEVTQLQSNPNAQGNVVYPPAGY